jgi:PAS domain S-box-containing protein
MSDVLGAVVSGDGEGVFFAAVWNSADIGMCVTDANRRFVKVNDAYCRLYGYDRSELVGYEFTKVLPEAMRGRAADIHDAFIAGAPESAGEWQVLRRDGIIVDVRVTAARVTHDGQTYKVTTVSDISKQKAAERKLQADRDALSSLEARYRTVIENFPNGQVIVFDHDLRYVVATGDEWNKLNIDASTLIGKSINDIFGRELATMIEPYYRRALAGEQFDVDLAFAGETYNSRFSPLYDDAGNVAEGLVITQRISERKRAEAEAKVLQSLVASATDGIALVDMDGKITYTNPAYDTLLGYAPTEALGRDSNDTLSAQGQVLVQEAVNVILAQGKWQGAMEHQHRDGHTLETLMTAFLLFDDGGVPTQIASIIRDVSEQRRAERQLELSEARLRMIVANLPVVVFTTDEQGIFTLSEGRGLASLGLQAGQVVGASLFELYANFPAVIQNTRRAFAGESVTYEIYIPGAEQFFEQYTAPLRDDAGNITGVLGVAYNITERKQASAALERTNTRLAQLNELNSQLNRASSAQDVLESVADYFGDCAQEAVLSLLYVETDAAGEPEWATVVANHLRDSGSFALSEGTQLFLPEFPSARVWTANPHEATFFLDAYHDPRLDANAIGLFQSLHLPSLVFLPLLNQGRWVGLLTVAWYEPPPVDEELIALCYGLPSVLAPVVEVTKLVSELEETLAIRTRDLQQSQALLRGFLTYAPGAVWVKDLGLRFMMANKNSEMFYGMPPEDVVGLTDADIFAGDKASEFGSAERQVIASKQAITLEEDAPSSLGTRHLITNKFPIFDDGGEVIAVGGFSTDITDLRREIQKSRNLMRLVIDNLPNIIVWKDRDLRFMGVNKAFAELAGFDNPTDMIGKTDFDTNFSREQAAAYQADDRMIIETGTPKLSYQESSLDADGNLTWVRASKLPLRDEQGEIIGVVALAEDITEQKAAAERLQAYREQLTRAETELSITKQIQELLIPSEYELQLIDHLDIAGFMAPAEQVGGDYYDVLTYGDGLTVSIGDVTGHGLESGLLMLMTQTAVRTLIASGEHDPKRFFEILNVTLYDNLQRMQADKSLTLSRLDYMRAQAGGQVRLSGQHEHLLVVRKGGEVELIDTLMLGLPLGLEASIERHIAEQHITLAAGDGVVLYTDGITEAESHTGEQYGLTRLQKVVLEHWQQPAKTICAEVISDVYTYIAEHTVFDDMSLVVVKQR